MVEEKVNTKKSAIFLNNIINNSTCKYKKSLFTIAIKKVKHLETT